MARRYFEYMCSLLAKYSSFQICFWDIQVKSDFNGVAMLMQRFWLYWLEGARMGHEIEEAGRQYRSRTHKRTQGSATGG